MPALLTRMSTGPSRRSASSNTRATAASSRTSSWHTSARRPWLSTRDLVSAAPASSRRYVTTTSAPASAKAAAIACPMPESAPVTSARRSARLPISDHLQHDLAAHRIRLQPLLGGGRGLQRKDRIDRRLHPAAVDQPADGGELAPIGPRHVVEAAARLSGDPLPRGRRQGGDERPAPLQHRPGAVLGLAGDEIEHEIDVVDAVLEALAAVIDDL